MRIQKLHIKNFRYIRSLEICDIENALILVGKNNVGKTAVLCALCAVGGQYEIAETDFNEKKQNIEIDITNYKRSCISGIKSILMTPNQNANLN